MFLLTILCTFSPCFFSQYLQEHTANFITRLLSPTAPTDFSGSESNLIGYAPFLNVLLVGISSIDSVQIFSLHGLVGPVLFVNSSSEYLIFIKIRQIQNHENLPHKLNPFCHKE